MKPKKKNPDEGELAKKAMFTNPPAMATESTGYVQRIPKSNSEAERLSEMVNLAVCAEGEDAIANLESKPE